MSVISYVLRKNLLIVLPTDLPSGCLMGMTTCLLFGSQSNRLRPGCCQENAEVQPAPVGFPFDPYCVDLVLGLALLGKASVLASSRPVLLMLALSQYCQRLLRPIR